MVWVLPPSGKRGRQQSFSDAEIQACLTLKVLFGMALQQKTGFVQSLLRLIGLDWSVPDFSTLCGRQKTLNANLPYRGGTGPLNLLIHSTGIKTEGERDFLKRSDADQITSLQVFEMFMQPSRRRDTLAPGLPELWIAHRLEGW